MNNTQNNEAAPVPVVSKKRGRGRPEQISYTGIRWDRMTTAEVAKQLWEDPKNKGKIKAKSLANFKVTVFLHRKKLEKAGKNVAFAGRTVTASDGSKVKKTKWVRSKTTVTA